MQYPNGNFTYNSAVPWLATPWPPPVSGVAKAPTGQQGAPHPAHTNPSKPGPSLTCAPGAALPLPLPFMFPNYQPHQAWNPWTAPGYHPMQFSMPHLQPPPWSSTPLPPPPHPFFMSSPASSGSSGLQLTLSGAPTSSSSDLGSPTLRPPICPPHARACGGRPAAAPQPSQQQEQQRSGCMSNADQPAAASAPSDSQGFRKPSVSIRTNDLVRSSNSGIASEQKHTASGFRSFLGSASFKAAPAPSPAPTPAPSPAPGPAAVHMPALAPATSTPWQATPPVQPSNASALRGVLGQSAFASVRSLMMRQQVTFTQQLHEMHKLAQMQSLLLCEMGASVEPAQAVQAPSQMPPPLACLMSKQPQQGLARPVLPPWPSPYFKRPAVAEPIGADIHASAFAAPPPVKRTLQVTAQVPYAKHSVKKQDLSPLPSNSGCPSGLPSSSEDRDAAAQGNILRPLAGYAHQPSTTRFAPSSWSPQPSKADGRLQLSEAEEDTSPASSAGMAAVGGSQSEASAGFEPLSVDFDNLAAGQPANASSHAPSWWLNKANVSFQSSATAFLPPLPCAAAAGHLAGPTCEELPLKKRSKFGRPAEDCGASAAGCVQPGLTGTVVAQESLRMRMQPSKRAKIT